MKLWDIELRRGKRILKSDTSDNSIEGLEILQEDCSALALARNNIEGECVYVVSNTPRCGNMGCGCR